MGLEIEAIYANGVLMLPRQLPLAEGVSVRITIHPPGKEGIVKHEHTPWTGTQEQLERLALEPEFGLEGTP